MKHLIKKKIYSNINSFAQTPFFFLFFFFFFFFFFYLFIYLFIYFFFFLDYHLQIFINEKYKDKLWMPIPIELIMVIITTTLSYAADLNAKYNLDIVMEVPTGLPAPSLPNFQVISKLVSFLCTGISISKLDKTKRN